MSNIEEWDAMAQAKEEASKYAETHGTLRGFNAAQKRPSITTPIQQRAAPPKAPAKKAAPAKKSSFSADKQKELDALEKEFGGK